jgi:hypothetical protein
MREGRLRRGRGRRGGRRGRRDGRSVSWGMRLYSPNGIKGKVFIDLCISRLAVDNVPALQLELSLFVVFSSISSSNAFASFSTSVSTSASVSYPEELSDSV